MLSNKIQTTQDYESQKTDTDNTYTGQEGPHRVYLQLTVQPIVNGL